MRMRAYAVLTLMALSPAAGAASKSKMPALLERAQYVALGFDLGDRFVSAENIAAVADNTTPEERRALEAIRADLEKWGRYIVIEHAVDAEILLVIRGGRRGRLEMTAGGMGGSGQDSRGVSRGETGGSRGGVVSSRTIGGQLSSNDDRVDVYEAVHGQPGIRLWSGAEVGGMAGSPPRLYKSFREEVEAETKKP